VYATFSVKTTKWLQFQSYEERNARKLQKAAVEAQLKEQEHQQAGH